MIVYASDNGYSWGSHRWEPKQCPYEECMRVPLAIRYAPLAPLPRVETGFGLNIDHARDARRAGRRDARSRRRGR